MTRTPPWRRRCARSMPGAAASPRLPQPWPVRWDRPSPPPAPALAPAVDVIREAKGRVIVPGLGKSGHVARKIAASLASTGTPAFFVHAAEASHEDLRIIKPED